MIDHITLGVNDVNSVKPFYDLVMQSLGYSCVAEEKADEYGVVASGYGIDHAIFWVCLPLDHKNEAAHPSNGTHIAFKASSKEQVDKFYNVAIENGGIDEGAPGLRPQYRDSYYAAFVKDPLGNKLEAVYGNSK